MPRKLLGLLKDSFRAADISGDGELSHEELLKCLDSLDHKLNRFRFYRPGLLDKDVFARYDYEGDGLLDIDEFCAAVQGELQLSNLFNEIDADQSGAVSVEEIKDFIDQHHGLHFHIPQIKLLVDMMETCELHNGMARMSRLQFCAKLNEIIDQLLLPIDPRRPQAC